MTDDVQGVAAAQLKSIVDRILRLKDEQDALGDDIKDVYAEAKGNGYDKTALGKLVSEIRAKLKNGARVEELESILDLYRTAYEAPLHTHTREAA